MAGRNSHFVSHRINWEMTIILLQNNIALLWTVRPRHVQLYCDPLISILVFIGITGVQGQLSEYVYYTVTITDWNAYNSITVLILLNRPRKYGLVIVLSFSFFIKPYSSTKFIHFQSEWLKEELDIFQFEILPIHFYSAAIYSFSRIVSLWRRFK